jgi:hypothetical protein
MSVAKDDLHELVDQLPETEAEAAKRFLEFLIEKADQLFIQALKQAPTDDADLSSEEIAAIMEAREDIKAGRVRPLSEIIKDLEL